MLGSYPINFHQSTILSLGRLSVLTISAHACRHALLESTVLTSVPVYPLDGALLVFSTGSIVDLLLDGPSEETLKIESVLIML